MYQVATGIAAHPVVLDVEDGDTFKLALVMERESGLLYAPWLRLAGVDAPEDGQHGYRQSKHWVTRRLTHAQDIRVRLYGWSFARRVADVIVDGRSLAIDMLDAGHAVRSEE